MGRFYRVPFKSLPRVQIKREIMYHSRRYWRIGSSRSFKRPRRILKSWRFGRSRSEMSWRFGRSRSMERFGRFRRFWSFGMVRGSDLLYSQFVFLRTPRFLNVSGNFALIFSHALVAKLVVESLNWFLIWLPTFVWVFFTFALYVCGLKPWSFFSWINCQSLLIHSHWPSSLIIFCLPEKSGSKNYNYFMLNFSPKFWF